jgi:hypothetical protein
MAIGVGEVADLIDLCCARHKSIHALGSYVELPDLEAGFARLPANLLSGYST